MTKLFKALGATLLAAGIVIAGVATPAFAAAPTINRTAIVVPGSTNTLSTSVLFDATPSGVDSVAVRDNTGKISFTSTSARTQVLSVGAGGIPCGNSTNVIIKVIGGPVDIYCTVTSSSILVEPSGAQTFASGLIFTVQLNSGALSFAATGSWPLYSALQATALAVPGYSANFALTDPNAAPSSYTVTFDSNGGSGSMTAQSANTSTALTSNAFSRNGYTFAGWNTAANGTGTAYANGASYAFTSNTTLYAQWTANSSGGSSSSNTLANTGINSTNGSMFLLGGLSLALIGAEMIMIARRKRSN